MAASGEVLMAAVTGDGTVHLVVYALRRSMAVASVPNPPLTPFETYPGVAPLRAQILARAAAPQVALAPPNRRRRPTTRAAFAGGPQGLGRPVGWPGALQPPAPSDPGVTVSRHRALLIARQYARTHRQWANRPGCRSSSRSTTA